MKKAFFLVCILIVNCSWSQDYRYTTSIFPSSTAITNVIYGVAPAISGPVYNEDSNITNQDLVMDIYKPTGDNFNLRPAVIFAHPGAFLLGNKGVDDMKALCDTLSRKGYVTASIDYRMGFSLLENTELHSVRAVYRGIQDGRAAVRYLRANAIQYGIDPTKIYFIGSSAGSFIALHTIYLDQTSEIPTQTGIVNYTTITPPFFHTTPSLGSLDIGANLTFNGKPDAVVSIWGAIQSTNLITASNTTPVLLIHGEADTSVSFNTGSPFNFSSFPPADGSNPINTKLNSLGFTNHETYFVPGEPHEFYGTTNGTWSNGTGGNSYLPIITNRITQFLWKQHKPIADFTWTPNQLSVSYNDTSTNSQAWWWDFGDGTFSNDQNPTHNYSVAGSYQVKLYIENNIKSWDTITKTVVVPNLSIDQNSNNLFSVHPNPTFDKIEIKCNTNFQKLKCVITSILGEIVMEKELKNTIESISLSSLNSGIYFVKLSSENSEQVIKIIKQ